MQDVLAIASKCKPGQTTMKTNEISSLHEGYTSGHRDPWVASLALRLSWRCSPVSSNLKVVILSTATKIAGRCKRCSGTNDSSPFTHILPRRNNAP
eukprot:scaffold96104_cov18-Prasinocladus_malaysianus.AAC.1